VRGQLREKVGLIERKTLRLTPFEGAQNLEMQTPSPQSSPLSTPGSQATRSSASSMSLFSRTYRRELQKQRDRLEAEVGALEQREAHLREELAALRAQTVPEEHLRLLRAQTRDALSAENTVRTADLVATLAEEEQQRRGAARQIEEVRRQISKQQALRTRHQNLVAGVSSIGTILCEGVGPVVAPAHSCERIDTQHSLARLEGAQTDLLRCVREGPSDGTFSRTAAQLVAEETARFQLQSVSRVSLRELRDQVLEAEAYETEEIGSTGSDCAEREKEIGERLYANRFALDDIDRRIAKARAEASFHPEPAQDEGQLLRRQKERLEEEVGRLREQYSADLQRLRAEEDSAKEEIQDLLFQLSDLEQQVRLQREAAPSTSSGVGLQVQSLIDRIDRSLGDLRESVLF